jgi:uncharacterized membrane protein required for colicin V production
MIALVMVFLMFLILFGFIGASRGWAKEVLVIASVILALAIITLLEDLLKLDQLIKNATVWYWIRMFILFTLVLFGYQSPKVQRISKATEKRAQIGDWILGFLMGMISGYFVVGTAWYFSNVAKYPLINEYIRPPAANFAEATERVLAILPPTWLDTPLSVFIALVVIFVFVIIFFL